MAKETYDLDSLENYFQNSIDTLREKREAIKKMTEWIGDED